MNPVTHSLNHQAIVYDADRLTEPEPQWFDPAYWEESAAVTDSAQGRGSTLMLSTPFGPAVLRPYLRGGWPARISRDRYVFTGFSRSRPFREFDLLRRMLDMGLPVPAPLAASCSRGRFTYVGALLMEEIPAVSALQQLLAVTPSSSPVWSRAGACVREFHEAGLDHVDLNVGNLLVSEATEQVFLVDFDRCILTPGKPVDGEANLARLHRSLLKRWPFNASGSQQDCWQAILDGYHG